MSSLEALEEPDARPKLECDALRTSCDGSTLLQSSEDRKRRRLASLSSQSLEKPDEPCEDPSSDMAVVSLDEAMRRVSTSSVTIHCERSAYFVMSEATWTELKPYIGKILPRPGLGASRQLVTSLDDATVLARSSRCLASAAVGGEHACLHAPLDKKVYSDTKAEEPERYEAAARRASWAAAALQLEQSGRRGALPLCSTIGVGYVATHESCLRAEIAYLGMPSKI